MKRCSTSLLPGKIQVKTTSRLHSCYSRLDSLTACLAPSAAMSYKPDMVEIEKFGKSTWKKAEMQEKNPLPSKEMIKEEKQAGES
ncbi:thymosin beta-4-like [Oryx dammah]|uniref:thymosin beta-4-like n=1 Tax=Oryx dammah TaxID=59534 RepID=UPI001A9BF301|nr:thymosin beta-4-like [Oryx dammah]